MRFLNTGHRGAMGVSPENTLASFRRAVADGATEIELDLRLSADGELVIMHDADVSRTTNGSGPIADFTLAELREFDAGDGERIPTFAEALDAVALPIQAEIKATEAVGPLLDLLRRNPELLARISPTSFHEDVVGEVAAALPETLVGLIRSKTSHDMLDRAAELGARRVLCGWAGADAAFVEAAHEREFAVGLWPVNSTEEMSRAIALRADGITTNYPAILGECGYRIVDGELARI
ncbi:MAG TPA: glycerophosphodiester phosphodiesterase family protein [Mycobacteriales bacterium]|nr:glycerophosphodiester phosphodiesterase family protein [Mycobacteriales bacterium]